MANDMGKIMIIPEQLVMLETIEERELLKSEEYRLAMQFSLGESPDKGEKGYGIPISESASQQRNLATLKRTREILETYTLIDTYCPDTIEIGTRFQILLRDSLGVDTMDLILIHKRVADESPELFISCDTQLGISLKGHKVGDKVSYKNGIGEACTAEVLKIYANRLGEEQLEEEKEGKLR